MKSKKLFLTITMAFSIINLLTAQGIAGSAHDFSTQTWSGERICIVCHTPHNADVSTADAPLWNHESTTAAFTPYASSTMDGTVGQPDASSKLCLSCHDGTVALENFGGTTTGGASVSSGDLTTDISDDHPISFTYNTALSTSDGELHDPSTASSGLGSTIDADMLIGGKMQCASCHDVHNTAGHTFLLVKDNTGSALCLTCHDK
jgi:predicted CXXCH cytochrome family protein